LNPTQRKFYHHTTPCCQDIFFCHGIKPEAPFPKFLAHLPVAKYCLYRHAQKLWIEDDCCKKPKRPQGEEPVLDSPIAILDILVSVFLSYQRRPYLCQQAFRARPRTSPEYFFSSSVLWPE